jgi:GNAT superfamily N-acetyltransferase
MQKPWEITVLSEEGDEQFLKFLNKDMIRHIFTIYDLKHMRDKTRVWLALENNEIRGYLFEFDKRIVHTHGTTESLTKLLQFIDLNEPVLIVEPHHVAEVTRFFQPVEPADAASKGKITTYLVMKTTAENFKPVIRHRVKKLGPEDFNEVLERFGEEWEKRVKDAVYRGMAYGAYENDALTSIATTPEIIDNIAFVRGVHTIPSSRGRGLATSAVSALVREWIRLGKEAALWVAEDNIPARRIYEKIGFQRTEHVLLGFKARRL